MSITAIATARPRASKKHWCWACGGAINPGVSYVRETNVYDGRIYSLKICQPCRDISSRVFDWMSYSEDGAGPETYLEWAYEHTNSDPDAAALLARHGAAHRRA